MSSMRSRSSSVSISLVISYLLVSLLCTPFIPTVGASSSNTLAVFTPMQAAAPHRDGEVLVRFRAGVSQADKDLVTATNGVRNSKKLRGNSGIDKWELPAGKDPKTATLEILANPQVEFAEPNFLIAKDEVSPNDPQFDQQWALRNTGQNRGQFGSDINAGSAWETTKGSQATVVAVIDSGIDFTHADLKNNQWTNPKPSAEGDVHGWDFVAGSGDIKDEQGHGTAIAGIIAAEGNNSLGTTGVLWQASLMSLRVLNNTGTGDVAAAVEAIDYAVTHGAHVINLSWGTSGESVALKGAIENAIRRNVVVVCSAGNSGKDLNSTPYYPASYAIKGLITVAGSDNNDQLASWSNFGSVVTVAAPGTDILTTKMGGGYWNVSGTSAAAPIVTGIAGLLKTVRGTANAEAVAKAITDGARQSVSLQGKVTSAGIANAAAALTKIHGPAEQAPDLPRPGFGTGGTGPGGSFSTTAPAPLTSPGMNLPNLDDAKKNVPQEIKTKAPIESNLPCADCDPYGGGGGGTYYPTQDPNFSTARRRLINETGHTAVDLGSRNFNWSLPLLNLKGRAGLDLSLTLAYNSLVWTKDGSYMKFNADLGSPAPGFRLGLPTLQQRFLNSQTGIYAYLMVLPSGERIELRQVSTNIYESQDGNYSYLDVSNPSAPFVLTSDGTRYTFTPVTVNSEFRCTQIKDRNGNYISATYNTTNGHLQTITDTLGRVITFVYDASSNLQSIRQTWAGATHDWATFYYGQVYVAPAFGGGLQVNGPNNNYTTVLTQVNLHDGTYFTFNYNSAFAQVNRINHHAADAHLLNYTSYNVSSSAGQTECPRFTERRDWAENWNNGNEAVTSYSVAADNSWTQQTTPDGVIYKEFFATSGWQTGLATASEIWSGGVKKTWTTTAWTQDNTGLTYQKNPRTTETNNYDAEGNRQRTTITYTTFTLPSGASCTLASDVYEYAADAVTVLRRTHTDYRYDSAYMNRRIIGLPSLMFVYEGSGALASKTWFDYDWPASSAHLVATPANAVQHDSSYDINFVAGRGNLVHVLRYDLTDPNNAASKATEYKYGYNTNGSLAFTRDHLWHQTFFNYQDSFSDGNNSRNTFAYPTTVTDPDNFNTTLQYNYDFGAPTRRQDPKGAVQTSTYDSAGRPDRITNQTSGAYARYVYGASGYVQTYTTIQSGAGEAYSINYFDGAGRVRATGGDLPNSTGGYSGQLTFFDVMGRISQQTNLAEMNASWAPSGDDAAGWASTTQTYDWNGRPLLTTNPDGTTREKTYSGCGCAGGYQTTTRDERGRRKRYTNDVLGRLVKVEELNWDQSVYSTTTYSLNARDQLTTINQAGLTRTFAYDGHGRLQSRTTPEQGTTTYTYFGNDEVQTVTDARGATTTFAYNNRDLVTSITFGVPGGVAATPNVTFGYDAAGNRTSMTDGLGSVSYVYNTLSQLTSETRTFTGVGSYTLSYGYNLSGELNSITNPWSVQVGYGYDKVGRITNVSGSGYAGVTSYVNSMAYRAFGVKQIAYNNGRTLSLQYDNRQRVTQWNIPSVMGWNYAYHYFNENTGRAVYAQNLTDPTLDRAWNYDHAGRPTHFTTGSNARHYTGQGGTVLNDGPFSQGYSFDVFGNRTYFEGWGGIGGTGRIDTATYTNNRRNGYSYDAAGNLTNDLGQTFTYDATGQQTLASYSGYSLQQNYDGDRLRVKKVENGTTTYYLRSSVLGGQIVAELSGAGTWMRGYVYLGDDLLAVQQNLSVSWVHQDPLVKSKRVTNSSGTVVSVVELDPWGGDTSRSSNEAFQPRRFNSYDRDGNASDEAMHRRYNRWHMRFDQPDPYDGSYDLTDPQSFNRYSYTQNDPVNFVDPNGLLPCGVEYSFSDCGGGGGFWGGGGGFGGHIGEHNREFGGLPPNIVSGMQNHNERMYNAIGGYGYITNAEVRQITAQVWVIDPETNERVPAGSAVWAEEGAWYERGVLGQIGLGLRGFADEVSMGLVSLIERSQGRLSPEEEEWLKTSTVHNRGAMAGFAASLLLPGPGGKVKAISKLNVSVIGTKKYAKDLFRLHAQGQKLKVMRDYRTGRRVGIRTESGNVIYRPKFGKAGVISNVEIINSAGTRVNIHVIP